MHHYKISFCFTFILFFVVHIFIAQINTHAQSLASLSPILNNLKYTVDTIFHFSSLNNIVATPISQNTFFSSLNKAHTETQQPNNIGTTRSIDTHFELGISGNIVISNLAYLVSTSDGIDTVLAKELIGTSTLLYGRIQAWTLPLSLGFHLGSIPFNINTLQVHWFSIGTHLEYILLTEGHDWQASLSTMLIYSYSFFGIRYPLSTIEIQGIDNINSDFRVKLDSPSIKFDANTHSIAWRLVLSKTWYSITPFLYLEPALYISNVSIVTDGIIYLSENRGLTYTRETTLKNIAHNFLNRNGLNDNVFSIKGSLQMAGGVQFAISEMKLGLQFAVDLLSGYSSTSISMIF